MGETNIDPTQDILQGKWPELKDQVQHKWSKLTDEDIARLSGKAIDLASLLQQTYHYG